MTTVATAKPKGPLRIDRTRKGRALRIEPGGIVYAGEKNRIFRSNDDGKSWRLAAILPCSPLRRTLGTIRLFGRLLRHDVRAMVALSDGTLVAANRETIARAEPDQIEMSPCAISAGQHPISPPLTITLGPNDRVIWSEYKSNPDHGLPVRVFVSDDGGRSFEVAHVFDPGEVLHLHNLIYDSREDCYWVLSGDWGNEPGIGRMSADFSTVEWVHKGDQIYRAVEAFDQGDHLLYATDSDLAPNALMRMDKATGKVTRLRELEGSCIYACRFGEVLALSTTVELTKVNPCRDALLYLSRDGEHWECVYRASKDGWHLIYFQFGSLVLPRGATDREIIHFSGQAVRGIDDRLLTGHWTTSK